jgi:hypothetical protein
MKSSGFMRRMRFDMLRDFDLRKMPVNAIFRSEYACYEEWIAAFKLLPSNVALEFSVQYESMIAFGDIRILEDAQEQCRALYGLLTKYFPEMISGEHYRPITDQELKCTSVYALAIDSWSGKCYWPERADQSPDWPALPGTWLA